MFLSVSCFYLPPRVPKPGDRPETVVYDSLWVYFFTFLCAVRCLVPPTGGAGTQEGRAEGSAARPQRGNAAGRLPKCTRGPPPEGTGRKLGTVQGWGALIHQGPPIRKIHEPEISRFFIPLA
eukprot:808739-Prorocentrum_minimum.AAC.1